ncbi:family 4 glycosyl hydrolase [Halanaerobacter jeridensis]|uniref:6-phospho-beta-glucosidase n=1 Tax=Halanaerobacter jeridensis TaxID=706427 RepID=A0A939BPP4_9FIRM|nr:glycosyl hydrolase family 4 [Halanaerobacter jeridensis]MBM7555429.1 6-phospho-beta-glucosidase [Halanaerobacter jeridensis]
MGAKLSVIGGSGLYTPLLFDAVINNQTEIEFDEICLNGRTESKLKLIAEVCQNLVQNSDLNFKVTYTTDRQEALTGSDFVLTQIRVGGMKARAHDEKFPLKYDIIGEETVGPGGFANALRTVPVMLDIAQEIEEYAPDSLVINLTNPASIVQQAIQAKTELDIISVCDLPVGVINKIANLLDIDSSALEVDYAGLNHLGWYTGFYYQGQDKLEEILAEVEKLELGVNGDLIRTLGAVPVPYMKYYHHHQQQVAAAKEKDELRAKELLSTGEKIKEELAANPNQIPETIYQRGAIWYSDVIVPLISALQNDQPQKFILNVANKGLIPELNDEVIVEVPAVVNSSRIKPLEAPAIPEQVKGIIAQEANFRNLATKAAISGADKDILRALLANPQVPSYEIAKKLLGEVKEK